MTTLPPSVASLSTWIGQTLDESDPRAAAVLSAASSMVQGYTGRDWTTDGNDAPDEVLNLVVRVAARVYLSPANPNLRNWTKGPFSEAYFDAAGSGLALTDDEKAVLNRYISNASGLGTISTTREDASTGTIYVPTGPPPSGYPFPWYAADGF